MRKSTLSDTIVSLIIVTNNDEDIIVNKIRDLKKILIKTKLNYEILVIDNNSQDSTIERLKKVSSIMSHCRILVLSKKYDTDTAFSAGLDNCVGDWALLFNIYTDPAELILKFISQLREGYDVIVGIPRFSLTKYTMLSKLLLWLVKKTSRHNIQYGQQSLIGVGRKAINSIIRTRRKSRNFIYMHSLIGLKKATITYTPLKRHRSKIPKQRFHSLFLNILDTSISNSFRPIRIVSVVGMVFSLAFLLYVLLIVILVFVFGMKHLAPQGWITVSTVLGTMFFLVFSLLGIISEYIIRILGETRDEPFYFVSEEINKSAILPKKRKALNIV